MDSFDRDGQPIPRDWFESTQAEWAVERRVGRTKVGDMLVSTVWLFGINHQWCDGPPLIFETMVFGPKVEGDYNHPMRRYSTEEDAMRGHLSAVDRLRNGLSPFAE